MKNVNWKVRIKHKPFLIALFSAVLLLVQQVTSVFGLDVTVYSEQITTIFNSVLGVLVIMGVVVDPTTNSIQDSEQAMTYKEPK